jgi:hypothetical protein
MEMAVKCGQKFKTLILRGTLRFVFGYIRDLIIFFLEVLVIILLRGRRL